MRRTSANSGPALSVLRGARVTLASLAASAVATAAVLALALGEEVRAWLGLAPQRPVRVGVGELWLDNVRTLLRPFAAAATVTWWPRARHVLDVLLSVVLCASVLLVAAALGAYGQPLPRLAPGHSVLEFLAVATTLAAYLDARRAGVLRTRILSGCRAATAVLPPSAAIFESAAA
jgi:hypothetical protein